MPCYITKQIMQTMNGWTVGHLLCLWVMQITNVLVICTITSCVMRLWLLPDAYVRNSGNNKRLQHATFLFN